MKLMSKFIVCYIVSTVFGKKVLYKHFNSVADVIDFINDKNSEIGVLDICVYKNVERK